MNTTLSSAEATFYKDKKHDYFFIQDANLYEKLTNGKQRHRLKLYFNTNLDPLQDCPRLNEDQVKKIEKNYLK